MPPGKDKKAVLATKLGFETGVVLGRWINTNRPDVQFVGLSAAYNSIVKEWFDEHALGILHKGSLNGPRDIVKILERVFRLREATATIFIVHGHDESLKLSLKNYLQNSLQLGEPIVLHEQNSGGRTLIEKFEEESADVDLVFVLLTPDDRVYVDGGEDSVYRARQNVIFELGYFFAKLQRRRGSVIVLHKGNVERPSDVSGIVFISVDGGIESAGEAIRREVSAALNLSR
jgi:hypothetical protein